MTTLTSKETLANWGPSKSDVYAYIWKHHLPSDRKTYTRVRNKLAIATARKQPGHKVSYSYSAETWQVIYGRMRVGGVLTYMATASNNLDLDSVHTIACHRVDAVEEMWLDDERVDFGASPDPRWSVRIVNTKSNYRRSADHAVFMALNDGNTANPVQADMAARHATEWTSAHKQSGRAHIATVLRWDASLFPQGIPEYSFVVRGKLLYDPRDGGTRWSSNAALVIADYLTNTEWGMGVAWADIETSAGKAGSFYDAANVCDEDVAIASGGTEKRYTIDGVFQVDTAPGDILERFATSIAGFVTYSNGKWKVFCGAYRTPTITITDSNILSDIQIETKLSRRETFNGVKGTFTSPAKSYQEDEFPAVKNDFYMSLDNNERVWEDIHLPFVNSAARCQRISKIYLEKARQQIQVALIADLNAWSLEVGETVSLTIARIGWSAKPFEVRALELVSAGTTLPSPVAVSLTLRETASGVYDWNSGLETQYDLATNSSLPNPYIVETVSGFTLSSGTNDLYLSGDGTVVTRIKTSWTPLSDGFVSSAGNIEISWKLSSSGVWNAPISIPGSSSNYYILDVQDGVQYDVRIRAKNTLGVYGEYTTVSQHLCLGKTVPPSDVNGLSVSANSYGVQIAWTPVSDLDVDHYEIRTGSTGDSWASAVVVGTTGGMSFSTPLRPAGTYRYFIKSVDGSGNYSSSASYYDLVLGAPTQPVVTAAISNDSLILSWSANSTQFAIGEYSISYGASFPGTAIGTVRGTTYQVPINWSGTRTFWVVARDVAGNDSAAGRLDSTITAPGAVASLSGDVFDNTALLKWTAPSIGSLPVDHYHVYKGATFSGATLIGEVSGTFSSLFETVAGSYTYWVVPVDVAGNPGTQSGITLTISQPPDYVLRSNQILSPAGFNTLTNAFVEGESIVCPVNTSQTWATHFTGNSWSTPNDQITAGYPIYIQPSTTPATLEEVVDYGTTLTNTIVSVSWLAEQIAGTCTVVCDIGHSSDGSSWTYDTNTTKVYKSSFRYIKVRLTVTASSATGIVRLSQIGLRLDVKQRNDGGGPVTGNSGDTSGTTVNFNVAFLDVDSITVTLCPTAGQGTTNLPWTPIVGFTDAPNPTSFAVKVYDRTGARVTSDFRWAARGV
jgi:hypothetical protein